MRTTLTILLALAILATSMPAMASSERLITNFSEGSILGQVESTQELQREFHQYHTELAQAGAEIGLTPQQYREVRDAIVAGRARYVELPQHIDAMTGAHDGHVFVVRNIRIPKGVYGWEVDLQDGNQIAKVYVPNRCGNLSIVRVRRAQVLAAAPVYHSTPVNYSSPAYPLPAYTPLPTAFNAPAAETAAYSPPALSLPQAAPAASHRLGILPLLLGGMLVGFLTSGGHGGGVTIGSGPTPPISKPTPTPTPVSCPTVARRRP
jgi:hypothetical protein